MHHVRRVVPSSSTWSLDTQFKWLMIVSGDRESEVRYLAEEVGITEIAAQKSPEEKLAIVRNETAKARTLYVATASMTPRP